MTSVMKPQPPITKKFHVPAASDVLQGEGDEPVRPDRCGGM